MTPSRRYLCKEEGCFVESRLPVGRLDQGIHREIQQSLRVELP